MRISLREAAMASAMFVAAASPALADGPTFGGGVEGGYAYGKVKGGADDRGFFVRAVETSMSGKVDNAEYFTQITWGALQGGFYGYTGVASGAFGSGLASAPTVVAVNEAWINAHPGILGDGGWFKVGYMDNGYGFESLYMDNRFLTRSLAGTLNGASGRLHAGLGLGKNLGALNAGVYVLNTIRGEAAAQTASDKSPSALLNLGFSASDMFGAEVNFGFGREGGSYAIDLDIVAGGKMNQFFWDLNFVMMTKSAAGLGTTTSPWAMAGQFGMDFTDTINGAARVSYEQSKSLEFAANFKFMHGKKTNCMLEYQFTKMGTPAGGGQAHAIIVGTQLML